MNALQPGTVVSLEIDHEVEFGYFLTNGSEEVLLHKNEVTKSLEETETVIVFLYQDHQGRLAATMNIPAVQIGVYDWVEVVGVNQQLGVFVNIGISKDILVSKDDLPALESLWPEVGDRLYVSLKTDRHDRLFGKLATEDAMREIAQPATRNMYNQNVTGYAYRLLLVGTFIMTEDHYIGFIHESQRHEEPRLGQKVEGRVVDVKQDGSINLSLLGRAHEVMDEDAEKIWDYLQSRGGQMPYGDKSLPDEIDFRFQMSKAAFKRALGRLMKQGKIEQKDGWTLIKKA